MLDFRLHFHYKGKQYRRALIKNENRAKILQQLINKRICAYKNGLITLSSDTSLKDFIFQPLEESFALPKVVNSSTPVYLSQLITEYQECALTNKEKSTSETEIIHLNHLRKFIKKEKWNDPLLEEIDVFLFECYKDFRLNTVTKTTINKELKTFSTMFNWGCKYKKLPSNVVKDVERYPREDVEFGTTFQVKEALKKPELSEKEIKKIKRYRYLEHNEVLELISLAEGHWLHPILVVLA